MASHGVATQNMLAVDKQSHLWELGYELFQDKEKMRAKFIQGDFLQMDDGALKGIKKKVDVVIAAQFLHLFSWEGQVMAIKKIVGLSKPGTVLVGYQQGRQRARKYRRPWGMMFYHNLGSYKRLWEIVQRQTSTRWAINVKQVELREWGMEDEDLTWMPEDRRGINFVITRIS